MKLLLADDHTLFRDVLIRYIERAEPDSHITALKNFPEVMDAMSKDPKQDIVLLDLRMPGMHGMEGFKTIREAYPDVPIALMSGVAEQDDVRQALALGVAGYFPKTLSGTDLLKAIRQVLDGDIYVPEGHEEEEEFAPSYYADKPIKSDHDYGLTAREKEVLSFITEGKSNKEIANSLGLQVVTIKLHMRNIYKKLGAQNRTQAALIASRESL